MENELVAGPILSFTRPSLAAACALALVVGATTDAGAQGAPAAARAGANSPQLAQQWRAIADLPDWSGIWDPDTQNERKQLRENKPPWNAAAQKVIDQQVKESAAGQPTLVLWGCFPHGMPTWMMINHNVMEILFTPGRVTMLGEVDGNRMRRIYTDGRAHPEDPDLTFHGHSVGKWEGDTLVVDTVGIAPQAPIAPSEAEGISNNGDMHIVERIRLVDDNRLEDQLTITAPKVFTRPWKTVSYYKRLRGARYDIVEGQCVRGDYDDGVDKYGNATFLPSAMQRERGAVVPLKP